MKKKTELYYEDIDIVFDSWIRAAELNKKGTKLERKTNADWITAIKRLKALSRILPPEIRPTGKHGPRSPCTDTLNRAYQRADALGEDTYPAGC